VLGCDGECRATPAGTVLGRLRRTVTVLGIKINASGCVRVGGAASVGKFRVYVSTRSTSTTSGLGSEKAGNISGRFGLGTGSVGTREMDVTKVIGIGIHPRDPVENPLIKKAGPLSSTSIFPYPY
jgi:hypothetical protein